MIAILIAEPCTNTEAGVVGGQDIFYKQHALPAHEQMVRFDFVYYPARTISSVDFQPAEIETLPLLNANPVSDDLACTLLASFVAVIGPPSATEVHRVDHVAVIPAEPILFRHVSEVEHAAMRVIAVGDLVGCCCVFPMVRTFPCPQQPVAIGGVFVMSRPTPGRRGNVVHLLDIANGVVAIQLCVVPQGPGTENRKPDMVWIVLKLAWRSGDTGMLASVSLNQTIECVIGVATARLHHLIAEEDRFVGLVVNLRDVADGVVGVRELL
jgi:hypothetical protein